MAEFLPVPTGRPPPLEPSAFVVLSFPCRSMWEPPCAITPRTRRPLAPRRRGTHLASHRRGRVDVRLHVVGLGASRTAMLGSRTLRDTGGVAGLARPRPVTAHARGPPPLGATDGLSAVRCTAPMRPPGVHLLPKPSISQRHEFGRGLLQNEPPMEARPVVAMPLP